MELARVEVLAYQQEAVGTVAGLAPFRFMLFVISRQLREIGRDAPERSRDAFTFCQRACYRVVGDYDRRNMCVLDETANWAEDFPFPDMRGCEGRAAARALDLMRRACEYAPCRHCGAVLFRGVKEGFCCRGWEDTVRECIPPAMPGYVIVRIQEQTSGDANLPGKLNSALRPVLQTASVASPDGPASTLFIAGIAYAVDCFGQFETTVYAVFRKNDDPARFRPGLIAEMIDQLLPLNPTLRTYLRDRVEAVRRTALVTIPEKDDSFNLAIVTNGFGRRNCRRCAWDMVDRS
jgi:hypothetical protein